MVEDNGFGVAVESTTKSKGSDNLRAFFVF